MQHAAAAAAKESLFVLYSFNSFTVFLRLKKQKCINENTNLRYEIPQGDLKLGTATTFVQSTSDRNVIVFITP